MRWMNSGRGASGVTVTAPHLVRTTPLATRVGLSAGTTRSGSAAFALAIRLQILRRMPQRTRAMPLFAVPSPATATPNESPSSASSSVCAPPWSSTLTAVALSTSPNPTSNQPSSAPKIPTSRWSTPSAAIARATVRVAASRSATTPIPMAACLLVSVHDSPASMCQTLPAMKQPHPSRGGRAG